MHTQGAILNSYIDCMAAYINMHRLFFLATCGDFLSYLSKMSVSTMHDKLCRVVVQVGQMALESLFSTTFL